MIGIGLVDHHRSPEVEVTRPGQERLQAIGLGKPVVVHEPDQIGTPLDGHAEPLVETAGTAPVCLEPSGHEVGLVLQPVAGAVG